MTDNEQQDPPSFWKVIGEGFWDSEKEALRFAKGGAIIGAALGAAGGFYLFDVLGVLGVLAGFFGGAIILGIAVWLMVQLG